MSGGALTNFAFRLNDLLGQTPLDLKRVTGLIAEDPSLAGRVVQMCNSTQMESLVRASSVEEAVILAGPQRIRALLLICALLENGRYPISAQRVQAFWQHSLLTATLCERMSQRHAYPDPEKAYSAGLLHDIGFLALWSEPPGASPHGVHHCEMGRWIGTAWHLAPEIVEALALHHQPWRASRDPMLVRLVAAADRFAGTRGAGIDSSGALHSIPWDFLEEEFAVSLARLEEG